jgi:hypothetical protein
MTKIAVVLLLIAGLTSVTACDRFFPPEDSEIAGQSDQAAAPESVDNGDEELIDPPMQECCEDCICVPPADPGGWVVDRVIMEGNPPRPTPIHLESTTVELFVPTTPMMPDPADGGTVGDCRNAITKGPGWQVQPVEMSLAGWTLAAAAPPLDPPTNTLTIAQGTTIGNLLVGSPYAWLAPAGCYVVKVSRSGQFALSPRVGVLENRDITDLHFCWDSGKWSSDLATVCD